MRAALRHLCQSGVAALQPTKVTIEAKVVNGHIAKASRESWRRPKVSKRVANDIRKEALRKGTYGSFCAETGTGWDPEWDLVLQQHRYEVHRFGGIKPSKLKSRERSREDRALALEEKLETSMQEIEAYYEEKEASRVQDKGIEAKMKRMAKSGGPGGGPR